MNPLISVVIPAYNEENYLTPCLKALKEQEYPKEKFEVIVVDNGSGDKTSEIAKNFGVRLIVYSQEKVQPQQGKRGFLNQTEKLSPLPMLIP